MAGNRQPRAQTPPDEAKFGRWSFWKRWFGQKSERVAARYLRTKGFRILATNVADRAGELDLLALDGSTVVVVEVRSRSASDPQQAAESVNRAKQKRITDAAIRYFGRRGLLGITIRFDVLAIAWPEATGEPTILHIPNAFEAVGRFQMFS